MRERFSKEIRVYTTILVVFVVVVICFLINGEIALPREARGLDSNCEILKADWYLVGEDGEKTLITPPTKVNFPRGEWMEVECVLPQIPDSEQMLYLRSSQQDMRVMIDGEMRERYSTKRTRPFGKASLSTNVFVDLRESDSGKTMTVFLMSPNEYSGTFNNVHIGTYTGILRCLIRQYGFALITAVLLLALGILTVVIGMFLQYKYSLLFPLKYASWAAIIAAVQAIVESKLRQFFFPNMSVAGAVSYLLVSVMPAALVLYIDSVQKERYRNIYRGVIILVFANVALSIILQVLNIQDLFESITRSYIIFGISMIVIFITFFLDLRKGLLKEIIIPAVGLILTHIMAVFEVLSQLLHFYDVTSFFLNIGAFFLITAAMIDSIKLVAKLYNDKQKAIVESSAKSDFLANMSHEIRTPINAIMGMNEMIIRESSEDRIRNYASDIKRAGENLIGIVNDILDFTKVESGKMEIVCREYSLLEMIRDIDNVIRGRAEKKGLEFRINAWKNCPSSLYGDDKRVRQIILNLLTNAVKYTDSGSIRFEISFGKSNNAGSMDEILMKFSVSDTGIGIKNEDREKLFENFRRFDLGRNRNIEGSGLGLAITHRIAELMHGRIEVFSIYGKGSTFTALIPQRMVGSEKLGEINDLLAKAEKVIPEFKESFRAPDAKVLVVDDVVMNANVIKGLLKKTEIKVFTAYSGKDAIELCKREKFDVILMDHFMPEMDGIVTLSEIRKKELQNCPVVALTANAIEGMKEMYLENGFSDYLSKPVNPKELESILKKYIVGV